MPTFRITPILTALALVSLPVFAPAQTNPAPTPTYEVASVRQNKNPEIRWRMSFTPDGVRAEDTALDYIIHEAYGADRNQQWADGPAWIKDARFDIAAKFNPAVIPHATMDDRRAMLQNLLADRFKLKIHHEQRDFPLYALVVGKSGPKFQLSSPADVTTGPVRGAMCLHLVAPRGTEKMQGCTMGDLAQFLGSPLAQGSAARRVVQDQTGLTGRYNLEVHWSRQQPLEAESFDQAILGPTLESALQEQLGLKLIPTHGPLDVIVIDHVEMPSDN